MCLERALLIVCGTWKELAQYRAVLSCWAVLRFWSELLCMVFGTLQRAVVLLGVRAAPLAAGTHLHCPGMLSITALSRMGTFSSRDSLAFGGFHNRY